MSNVQTFTAAKGCLRRHPEWTDAQVAEDLDIRERDRAGMAAIAEARKDLAASDTGTPHLRPASSDSGRLEES